MSPTSWAARLGSCIGIALLLAPAIARAESANEAEKLFHQGQRLLEQGKIHDACASFAESKKLDPTLGTLLNLADCHAQEHKTATASAEFLEAAALAGQRGQRERADFARAQVAELEKTMAYLRLEFAADAKIDELRIDSVAVDRATWSSPIALDPGAHALSFAAAGKLARSITLDVEAGSGTKTLAVTALEDARRPVAPAARPPSEPTPRTIGFALGGLGIVAIGVGTYFGLRASADKSDGNAHCSGHLCDAQGLSLEDSAHSSATVSTIAFAVGIAGLGAGIYLALIAPGPAKAGNVRVRPVVGRGHGGAGIEASF